MDKALASVTELSDWIGEPITEELDEKRAGMCLRVASALVRSESGRTWLTPEGELETVPETVVSVTLYCASRMYENRTAQTRGGVDDYTEGWKVDEAGAYLTVTEKRMLSGFSRRNGGLSTIATTRVSPLAPYAGLVPTGTPNVEFPWY